MGIVLGSLLGPAYSLSIALLLYVAETYYSLTKLKLYS